MATGTSWRGTRSADRTLHSWEVCQGRLICGEQRHNVRYLPGNWMSPKVFVAVARRYEVLTASTVSFERIMARHLLTVLGDALWRTEACVPLPRGGGAATYVDHVATRLSARAYAPDSARIADPGRLRSWGGRRICPRPILAGGGSQMDNVVLSTGCLGALVIAAVLAVRWRSLVRQPAPVIPSDRGFAVHLARTGTVGVVGGIIAGVLVAGLGSRLVMRVLAATSGEGAEGALTEAEERVGEITAGGTVGLVVFVGVLGGVVGGLLYVMVRRVLPTRAWAAGLVFGVLLLVCTARLDPLSPDNRDFRILKPTWLAVVLVAALFPAFGLVVAAVVERLDRSWPQHPASFAPLLLLAPAVFVAVLCLLVASVAFLIHRLDWHGGSRLGAAALMVAGALGTVWTGAGIVSIMT